MSPSVIIRAVLQFWRVGGVAFAFVGGSSARIAKAPGRRVGASRPRLRCAQRAPTPTSSAARTCTALLKDLEKQQAEKKQRPTLRKRIEQAGLDHRRRAPSGCCRRIAALVAAGGLLLTHQTILLARACRLRRRASACRAGF